MSDFKKEATKSSKRSGAHLKGRKPGLDANEEKAMRKAWAVALRTASARNGSFRMAYAIFFRKFKTAPPARFTLVPTDPDGWDRKVRDLVPWWRKE